MAKVIETNISLYPNGEMADFQSRVIEVESWELFVDEVKNKQPVERKSYIGSLHGLTIPTRCKVINFAYLSDSHFKCKIIHFDGREVLKFAYLVDRS